MSQIALTRPLLGRRSLLVAAALLALAGYVSGDERVNSKTGVEFRKAIEDSVGVNWGELTLREAMHSLSRSQRLCVMLDRRVDPDQLVKFTAHGEPLEQLLERFAADRKLGCSLFGSVVYLGPREPTNQLATLAAIKHQAAAGLPNKGKAAWLRSAPLAWPELAEPRALIEQLVAGCGASLANAELIPHDLWNAGSLPALPACDRLTFLLAGFGLTFEFENNGAEVRLAPAPEEVVYRASYPARGDAGKAVSEIQRLFPEVEVTRKGTQLLIAGRYEDHQRIERLLRGETVRTAKTTVGEKRFSVNVERQPAVAVVKRIATDTNREFKCAPELVETIKEPVSFRVENASLDELLKATLGRLDVAWKYDDKTLEIFVPK